MDNELKQEAAVDSGKSAAAKSKKKSSEYAKSLGSGKAQIKKSSEKTVASSSKNTVAKTDSSSKKISSPAKQNFKQKINSGKKIESEYSEDEELDEYDVDEDYDDEYDEYDDEEDYNDEYDNEVADAEHSETIVSGTDVLSDEKTKKKKRRPLMAAIPIVTAVAILSAGVIVSSNALGIFDSAKHEAFIATKQSNANLSSPQGKFLEGISVQGVDLGGKTMTQAKEQLGVEESKLIPSINYTLTCHDKIVYLTEDDFEFEFDTVKVLNEAYEYSEYMREILMDKGRANLRELEKKDYPITMTFKEDSIKTACEEVAKKVNVEMEDAHVTNIDTEKDYLPDMFSFAEGVVGYSVDVDDLVTQIKTLKRNNNFTADITGKMEVVEPKTNLEDLLKNLVLISKYETYSGNTWEGNMNMTVAMQSMTGSIIKPGEVFSFNGKTGDSNLTENGYYSAGVIVNGASANGVGGGICQAATTIYNAAIRAGMTVVEREPHTWPSTYVPVGIDSAIDYGSIDMKFRNDTDHEVYLICYMEGATLHAYIYGYKPSDFDEIVVSSWFTGASGVGFGASASRHYYKDGKIVKTENLPDSFYSNGGGSSYAYEEPPANYVFDRVFTDKQATKLAAKIAEENKTKATKSTDTEKSADSEKTKSSDKDSDSSDITATNDVANNVVYDNDALTGGLTDQAVTVNTVIEDYSDDTIVTDDIVISDEPIETEPTEVIEEDYTDDIIEADNSLEALEE